MAGTKWTFTLPEEPKALMRVPPLGLDVQPLRLEGDDYASIVKLLRPEPSEEDARLPARYPAVDEKAVAADDALDDAGLFDHAASDHAASDHAVGDAVGALEGAVDASVEVVDDGAGGQDAAAALTGGALTGTEDWRSAARREAMLRLSSAGPPPDVPIEGGDALEQDPRPPLPAGQVPTGGGTDTGSGSDMPSADPARAERSSVLRAGERAGPDPEVQADVEVRVLGRVEVGGIGRIERGKSEELIVFLALHPEGVDGDRISDALWRGVPPAKATLNTTTTVARNSLGALADGSLRLPHARNGVYRLDPSVGLDWARFQALVTRAESKGAGGSADLRLALELVRGRPFEGVRPRTYGWALLDLAAVMEAAVVDAADRLAELRLDDGDAPGAQWAARRGLKISPYDERLYRRLMLAADLAGNPAGVEAVMEELLKRLDDDSFEPWDAIHEETRTLYERLRGARQGTPPSARRRA
jgi:DNA-binding SARP family transcriptional activator